MQNIYLLSYGEISLKGKNRQIFIKKLAHNIIKKFSKESSTSIKITYGRSFLYSDSDTQTVYDVLSSTFGLVGFSRVFEALLTIESIKEHAFMIVKKNLEDNPNITNFKIAARRSNKLFSLRSFEINKEVGALILNKFPGLKVKMDSPDLTIIVEVREKAAYIYSKMEKAPGGLPVGVSGKGFLLLSGGIDSPVAAWMMLKRGMNVTPIHFFSPPYTSPRARQKVIELATILKKWGGTNKLTIVNFTEIQENINKTHKKEYTTLFVRKAMFKIAEILALENKIDAIITGENLGQVASQTVHSMKATSYEIKLPIFRPLIGMDKIDIIAIAKVINTYETSIQPYEDCCTLFLPEYPATHPKDTRLNYDYNNLNLDNLIENAIKNIEILNID